jgi:hypothetical protein
LITVNKQDLKTKLKFTKNFQKSKLPEKRKPVFQVLLLKTESHPKKDSFSFQRNFSAFRTTRENEILSFNLELQKSENKTAFKERCKAKFRKIPA